MNNQQTQLIKKLKAQGIVPNNIYFQHDFSLFFEDEDSYPKEDLFFSLIGLENNRRMYSMAIQDISQIKLNDNYQYNEVWQRKRNIIEILYPTDSFQSLEDGVYFYTLNENKQLHQHASFDDVFELPCYLRVEKKHGIVISIQKRPLSEINHYTYDYWPNNKLKQLKTELYDNEHNVVYSAVVSFDKIKGKMLKVIRKNIKTGNYVIGTYIRKNGIYAIDEYFDKQGIKTNHVTRYENSLSRVKNEVLNKQGKVIKTKSHEPELFDFEKDLDEPYPYNKLMMNVEKSNTLFKAEMFKQGLGDSPKYDKEATDRVNYLGIQPHQVYYHKLPFPAFMVERYKNFPHQAPLTLIEAENQSPRDKYSDLIQVEIGENHQYKKIIKTKWQQSAISLPLAPFKGLENGVYFYTMNDKKQLTPLANVEQAVSLPAYIRVEKVMGKVVSILQKTRVQWLTNEFDYKKSAPIRSKLTVIESHLVPNLVIETEFEKGSYLPLKQVVKNAQGITIRTFIMTKKRDLIAILERFNDQGIKTNHIELFEDGQGGYLKNQHLDSNGNILLTTDEFEDKNNPQLYDNLPFNPDGFETILFEHVD
ncbi:hypothetical protein [Candidatus Schmidhempelia bombi]|uniref:Uncharacterized protein n=1 Tax=Candidatus Schmidhempelia bombi str. Bimp TaxID=1387197 RepID=A0AB94IA48_9GAMM|nr:hypothetical protein [Candidatus Schmidhempelia bombi]TEA26255.1 hypothetical protein O970_09560 [Candidatus Schmidhempelia bombi str. Bimp]TEA26257.1 hypothetical protein O970_09570 [Candidatus Schmidhempelia bombi str. Bimp]